MEKVEKTRDRISGSEGAGRQTDRRAGGGNGETKGSHARKNAINYL